MDNDYDWICYDANGKPRWGAGRVAFLAHIDPIIDMLRTGASRRTVYRAFAESLCVGYRQFSTYVNRFTTASETLVARDIRRSSRVAAALPVRKITWH